MTFPDRQESVEALLARSASEWKSTADQVHRVARSVQAAVGAAAYEQKVPELHRALEELRKAAVHFEASAKRPEIVIATTGTTSSGKSTLANLLIGEALLPKAVQEMSAGVVTVEHDDEARRLVIERTPGATWATGTWKSVTAAEVRERLESTMHAYRGLAETRGFGEGDVAPPRFLVTWPMRMGRRSAELGLPPGARLRVVDLPGLKYVDDDLNGDVVRDQARKALCLVAYNAFDTDPRRQESLLRQVVDQVKALGGSPARMLFVLNRIDAFCSDRDPEASEREFRERVTRQIRSGVREALAEYAAEADAIQPVALSSEPALYATLIEEAAEGDRQALIRKLTKEYATLFPDEPMDRLPRAPSDWTCDQLRWFLDEARHQSRLVAFEKTLTTHIRQHLPELLLPELVESVYAPARKALEQLDALIASYCLEERAQAETALKELESVHQRLVVLQREATAALTPFREVASGDGDLVANLYVAVPQVEAALASLEGGRLSAVASALPDAIQVPLQRLHEYVYQRMADEPAEDMLVQSLSTSSLGDSLLELRTSPYGAVWQRGGRFEGDDAARVRKALDAFAAALSSTATNLVRHESAIQGERVKKALDACGRAIVDDLEVAAASELDRIRLSGLRGVFRGEFELSPPHLPRVRFSPSVKDWTHTRTTQKQEEYWVEKRVWWTLWMAKRRVKQKRVVTVEEHSSGIEVAKFGDLIEGFVNSGALDDLESVFTKWLADSLDVFDSTLEQRLSAGVKTYRDLLLERKDEIEHGTQERIEDAERHRTDLDDLARVAEESRRWRERDDG